MVYIGLVPGVYHYMNKKFNIGVYLITNKINGKVYVGKSFNLSRRLYDHKKAVEKDGIDGAIRKYGWENFDVEILDEFDEIGREELLDEEEFWIAHYDSTNRQIGYNVLKRGTDRTGIPHTEEAKKRMSLIRKGKTAGDKHPMYGKRHSEETKQKISRANKNKRSGQNSPRYGKRHTDISKKKVSEGLKRHYKGKHGTRYKVIVSEETRAKMRQRNYNFAKIPVKQIDKKTGGIIKIWDSLTNAVVGLGKPKSSANNISMVCRKYINNKGVMAQSAFGYNWELATKEELAAYETQIKEELNNG